jgi:hypothetical protein
LGEGLDYIRIAIFLNASGSLRRKPLFDMFNKHNSILREIPGATDHLASMRERRKNFPEIPKASVIAQDVVNEGEIDKALEADPATWSFDDSPDRTTPETIPAQPASNEQNHHFHVLPICAADTSLDVRKGKARITYSDDSDLDDLDDIFSANSESVSSQSSVGVVQSLVAALYSLLRDDEVLARLYPLAFEVMSVR